MKAGTYSDGEIDTVRANTIVLTETELYRMQEIPGAGKWTVTTHSGTFHVLVLAEDADVTKGDFKAVSER